MLAAPVSIPPNAWPATALTRCWVVWQNGYKKTFHSFDTSGRYQIDDPRRYGIQGLRRRILGGRWTSPLKEVRLYDNQTGQELEVWVRNGVRLA
jgi:hypothetical protein